MSVQDIKNLVQREKEHEQRLEKAKIEAAKTIEDAEKEAKKIISEEAENDAYYENIKTSRIKIIEDKIRKLTQEYEYEIQRLMQTANANVDKTVDFIVKCVLRA